jgi:hypothetical protein
MNSSENESNHIDLDLIFEGIHLRSNLNIMLFKLGINWLEARS